MKKKLSDMEFLNHLESKVKIGNILFTKSDVTRIHYLADRQDFKPEGLNRDYYRMPSEYILPMIKNAKVHSMFNDMAQKYNCRILKRKRHLALVVSN